MLPTYRLHPQHTGQADPDVPDTVASKRENDCSRDPKSHPIHHHNLYLVSPTSTWTCSACQHSSAVEIQAMLCYHCETCSFYVCKDCYAEVETSLHKHLLYRTDVTQISAYDDCVWVCDNCEKEEQGNCFPAHCSVCQYDLCNHCIESTKEASSRQGLNLTERGEPAGQENERTFGYPGHPGDSTIPECVMCHKRSKKATVIHGATGHHCCCMPCAQKLFINGDRCPICLVPIENVVEVFD